MSDDGTKLLRKEGIKYVRCEHLINGSMIDEITTQWIGETKRVVLCAICANNVYGLFLRLVATAHNLNEYEPEIEKIKPIETHWVSRLLNFFSPRVTISVMDYNERRRLAYLDGQKDAFDYVLRLAEETKEKEEQNNVADGE